jgi:prepilin-type N-terminal cleavage/methylation domain-containing protein
MKAWAKNAQCRGFTLVELLVTMVISMIIILGIYQIFTAQQRSYSIQGEAAKMQQQARAAEEVLNKTIQQAGGFQPQTSGEVVMFGNAIIAASDNYIVMQFDDPYSTGTIGNITNDEIVAFVVTRDLTTIDAPNQVWGTDGVGVPPQITYDIDGLGTTEPDESEAFIIRRNLKFPGAANEDRLSLYMVTPDLENGGAAPKYELVASGIDNLIFRYYDSDGQLIRSDLPYNLDEDQVKAIRTVEMELVMRTSSPDPRYTPVDSDLIEIPAFSVGTYGENGLERDGTGTVDAFGNKAFILGKDSHATEKNYRRRTYVTKITPRNLANIRCGTIVVTTIPDTALCPNPSTINTVVYNGRGVAVSTTVNLTNNNAAATFTPDDSGDTVGSAGLDLTLNYTGTQTSIDITATAPAVECTDGSVEPAQGFATVNFAPGPSIGVEISEVGPDFDTCPGTWSFRAISYDACGNVVPAPAGITFETIDRATLPTGGTNTGLVVGTLTNGGVFDTDDLTFTMTPINNPNAAQNAITDKITIALHTTAPFSALATAGIQLTPPSFDPDAVGLTGVAPFNTAITTVDMRPWPPSVLINNGTFLDYICEEDNLRVVNFSVNDCLGYTITQIPGAELKATITPSGSPPDDVFTTGGIAWENNTFTYEAHLKGPGYEPLFSPIDPGDFGTFDLYHYVPPCLLDPSDYPGDNDHSTSTINVDLSFSEIVGTGTIEHADAFSSTFIIEQCLDCSVAFEYDVVTPCKGTATVTVTDCDKPEYEEIVLRIINGTNAFWVDANGNQIITDPTDHAVLRTNAALGIDVNLGTSLSFTATLSTGDTPVGTRIEVEFYADQLKDDDTDRPLWTCPTRDGTVVQNACMDINVFNRTSDFGDQLLADGLPICGASLQEIIVEMDYCAYTGDKLAQDILLEVRLPGGSGNTLGEIFDKELVPLFAIDSGTQPVRFFRGSIFTEPSNETRGSPDGILEFPKETAAFLVVDPDGYESTACPPQSMGLTPPLPLCFPNAITSGGGASWNGNFKVHWGDVVVRGTLEAPNAYIEKYPAGGSPEPQFDGDNFDGKSSLTDRFVDVYVGHSTKDETNTYPDGNILGADPNSGPDDKAVYQPFKDKDAGNYFANITYDKITRMIVQLNYVDMRSLALGHSTTSYWVTAWKPGKKGEKVFKGIYNPKTGVLAASLEEVLHEPATNDNYDGEFIFVDTWGKKVDDAYTRFAAPVEDDETINAAAADDLLPTHSVGGNSFYTTGIIYIAGNFDYVGQGSARTVNVTTPPGADLDYDHNTDKVYSEAELPIRPDPIALQSKFDVELNINGAIYVDGYFSGGGAPKVYGALTGEHGYRGNGAPEVWYNYTLNQSGAQNALCVECCEITASKSVVDIYPPGGTPDSQDITISGATGTGSDITWRSQNEDIATVALKTAGDAMTVTITSVSEGNTMVWVVDKNNCTLGIPVRVSSTCVGVSIDPAIIPIPGSTSTPFLAGLGVETFEIVDIDGEPYGFGLWEWSTWPPGSDIVSIANDQLLGLSKVVSAEKCGTVVLRAIDKRDATQVDACTGIYESIVTVSSTLETTTVPDKTVFQVGDTVDITATGGSGQFTWRALPSNAVTFSDTTGPTTTVTFLREVHVKIDVADENSCTSAAEDFVVRCAAPNVLNNIVATTLGTEAGLPNMYWRATVDDNDPVAGGTFDQVDRVEFFVDPIPAGFWPPAGVGDALDPPRVVESASQYCAFRGDDCNAALGDISQWPSGPYTLTATAYVTDPDYSCNATGASTESFGSGTIDIYIDNCGYEYVDNFISLNSSVWAMDCYDIGDPDCTVGTSNLNVLSNSLFLNAEPSSLIGGASATFAYVNGAANTSGEINREVESGDDYYAYVRVDGLSDSTASGSIDTAVGIAIFDELDSTNRSLLAIVGKRSAPADDTAHRLSYFFDRNLGSGVEQVDTGLTIPTPYYLGLRKSGNNISIYASQSLDTLFTAPIATQGIQGLSGRDYVGLLTQPPVGETATGQFSDFRLDCVLP